MIVVDFNSHSRSWGCPSLDAIGEVEYWIVCNHLVLINTPTNPPTFYSRVWKTTCTRDIAMATDNIQRIAKWEVSEQLGGNDHKPVIMTFASEPVKENCLPVETGNASGNSMTSTPSRSPSRSTVLTRMPPILTLQSSKQQKSLFQGVDSMTGAKSWRRSTRNWVRPERKWRET